jgi:beta-galactosidase
MPSGAHFGGKAQRLLVLGAVCLALLLAFLGALPRQGAAAMAAAPGPSSRSTLLLGAGWRFLRGDVPAASAPDFTDAAWTKVTLPHSFNAGEGDDGSYYRGPGWYRHAFTVTTLRPGRRLFVQFDGAATVATVYLNGRRISEHAGAHAAFRLDLTEALVTGRNLLAVRVDNSPTRIVTPLGGDFTLFGGLYRPVSLIETDDVHLDLLDHGGPGIYVRATDISPARASLSVDARVANAGATPRRIAVTSRVLDARGAEVARMTATALVPAGATVVAKLRGDLPRPHLWDGVRDPYLYHVVTRIGEGGDAVSVPLGIRSFSIEPASGFFLNGKSCPLRGANLMHSARPGKGTAVTAEEIAEDFGILRDMGSTAVRLVHFQHPQAAYDEADRLGLAVWTEIGINSEVEDTPAFRTNAAEQLRELIAQNYNHPSVVLWGIGNEVYADQPYVTRALQGLQQIAKATDPSRPTVYAHCCQADNHPKAMVTDVIGFNRYFGWYPDSGGNTIGRWAAGFHAAHPERAFAVSEYGAGASILHQADPPGSVDPPSGWHPEQFQALYHERNWRELKDKPYLFGTFVWTAFDLASAGRNEGDRRGINDKGLVTYDRRVRKDAWYWYQANWSARPMLYITSRRFRIRAKADAEVKAYTNAGPATLRLNGATIGSIAPVDHILRWKVTLRPGLNRVEVRSRGGVSDSVEWIYQPAPSMVAD